MANTSGTRGNDARTGTTGQTGNMGRDVQSTASGGLDKARDAASSAYDTARDTASAVAEKARDVTSNVVDKAKDVASNVADTAHDWASAAGHKASDLASSGREMLGQAEDYVADAWERGRQYVQREGFSGMAEDLAGVIRRNPIPALLVGIGIGFLIARSTSSRS
jgi:hypothetical protein